MLEGDRLPPAALLHVDPSEHELAVGIFSTHSSFNWFFAKAQNIGIGYASYTSPISIGTTVPHGLSTGQQVLKHRGAIKRKKFCRDTARPVLQPPLTICKCKLELPWSEHAFDAVWGGMGNQIALRAVERFAARVVR